MSRVMRVLAAIQSFFQEKAMTVRRTWLAAAASAGVAMALMLGATNALARDNVTWSVGIGVPGVVLGASNAGSVYYSPPPAYYAPAPVYRAPPPAYYAPPPLVYSPPVFMPRSVPTGVAATSAGSTGTNVGSTGTIAATTAATGAEQGRSVNQRLRAGPFSLWVPPHNWDCLAHRPAVRDAGRL